MKSSKAPPRACASWIMELLDYDAVVEWMPGRENTIADAFSRLWKFEASSGSELNFLDANHLPEDQKLSIVRDIHADPVWGSHQGVKKTLHKLSKRFIWHGMKKDVERVCADCHECLLNRKQRVKAPLTPVVALSPWNIIGLDIVGPFPVSHDHKFRYILSLG
jgi:hypothetical protein